MRSIAAILILFVPAQALADLIPPGTRNIPVEHRIETDQEHSGWAFFVVRGSGGVSKVTLDAKTPIVIPGSSAVGNGPPPRLKERARTIPYRAAAIYAVPVEELKKFKTDKELLAAVEDGKAPGMHSLNGHFPDHLNAKAADPRKSIVHRYRLTKLDAKTGATLEPIPDDKRMEEEAAAPTSFPWVAAGLALAGLVAFVGLALAARLRKAG